VWQMHQGQPCSHRSAVARKTGRAGFAGPVMMRTARSSLLIPTESLSLFDPHRPLDLMKQHGPAIVLEVQKLSAMSSGG